MVSGEDIPNFYFNKGGGVPLWYFYNTLDGYTVVFMQHWTCIQCGIFTTRMVCNANQFGLQVDLRPFRDAWLYGGQYQ